MKADVQKKMQSLDVSNGFVKSQAFVQLSDRRLKKNITEISDAIELVQSMIGYKYQWKSNQSNDKSVIGFIAQEIAQTTPEVTMATISS